MRKICIHLLIHLLIQLVTSHPFARVSQYRFCVGSGAQGWGKTGTQRGRGLAGVPGGLCLSQICLPTSCHVVLVSPLNIKGLLELVPKHLAHTDISDF